RELTDEELKTCWDLFIQKLSERKNHSAVTNFKDAELRIIDNNSIEIITGSNIQQKFIEQERAELIHWLQDHFSNRQLIYNVVIVENEQQAEPREKPLNTKQQFQKIVEEYPLVQELKDRLRLELDY
ncbi:MAG TPA: DNA polymerase III subunit gamma/tau, partial [Ferruginibacter sp.]|nr:DNA polymerase III subunit gamma/tau [Ferruginibacter sp.]